MKISLEWLSDFVEVPTTEQLVDWLSRAGIAVDEVHDPGAHFKGVVVGLVEKCTPHPESDKLKICVVFDSSARHQVVCGSPNVAAGQRAAFARVGAELPGGLSIGKRSLRGVDSFGMLCGRDELGLGEKSDDLWTFPEDAELGADVLAQAHIGPVLTLDITPNRPDLLSHVGVAREVAAWTGKRSKPVMSRATEKGPDVTSVARVAVDDVAGCKRYVARVVHNIKVGPSPMWLRERLEQVGQRSINNVVDATNYVLMELGQPMHAFDLGRLGVDGGLPTLRVRRAEAGETLKTLDGVTRTLDLEDLVIADAKGPVALAGVIGGASSEVAADTTDVLLESAWFDPSRVRRTARRHGLHTEASHRFERGADPAICQKAVDRCAQLLLEIAEGEISKGILEVAQKPEPPREIRLRLPRLAQVLGIELAAETVVQLMEPLEIRCVGRNEDSLHFQAPSFRPDLTREIDLIEEVLRRYGYDKVPERLPDGGGPYVSVARRERPRANARQVLLALGCSEIVTFGFGSPSHYASELVGGGEPVRILNPLGEEYSAMRTALLPGVLTAVAHNQRHGQKHVRLFEIGTVFAKRSPPEGADARDRDLPHEEERVSVAIYGGRGLGRWHEHGEQLDFADLAGLLDALVESFDPRTPLERTPGSHVTLNARCTAALQLGHAMLGYAGQVHPRLLDHFGVQGPVYAFEFALPPLAAARREVRHKSLPKFPGTRRDIAVVAPRDLPAETLRSFIAERAGGALGQAVVGDVRLFDVYQGKPIPETHTSLAFAIDYRSPERTLTDAEVGAAFEQLIGAIKQQFQVEVRSAS